MITVKKQTYDVTDTWTRHKQKAENKGRKALIYEQKAGTGITYNYHNGGYVMRMHR